MAQAEALQFRYVEKDRLIAANKIYEPGEPIYEVDTGEFKIGNGVLPYTQLPYITSQNTGGGGGGESDGNSGYWDIVTEDEYFDEMMPE